jgi:hypothetical protein
VSVAPAPPRGRDRLRGERLLGGAILAAFAVVLLVQLLGVDELVDVAQPLTAGFAKALVGGYAIVALALCAAAAVLPVERLALPVLAAAAVGSLILLATLSVGAEAGSLLAAAAAMAACWQIGAWALGLLRLPGLAAVWPAAWLVGGGLLGAATLFVGRAGLLRWWTLGVPVLLIGASTLRHAPLWARTATAAWRKVTGDRLGAAAASICLLLLGLAAVWTAAPELMFDALYAKAWLPAEWARSGAIEPLAVHPVLNNAGFAQLLAVPGQLVGAGGVGRYMQWLAAGGTVATVWWACRASAWAPLAAAAVAVTPQLFWQSTTAFDDALLMLAVLGLALAVLRSLERPELRPLATGVAIGFMAGTCVNFKLHLAALAFGLLVGWLAVRAAEGRVAALGGVVAGGIVSVAPPFALRWIDVDNPLLPAWNNVFRSELWPARNEQLNFPFLPDPGPLGPLNAIWTSLVDPSRMNEAAPVGSMGLLVAALAIALLFGFRPRRGPRALVALWVGLALACVLWYLQFRYLRYLLPAGAVAVVLVTGLVRGGPLSPRAVRGGLAALGATAVLLWPGTVAQFWNVPGRDIPWEAALRLTPDRDYESQSMPERAALEAFDRIAPPGALAVSDAHQRAWLTEGRDLAPAWEALARLEAPVGSAGRGKDAASRLEALGIGWILAADGGTTLSLPVDQRAARRADLVWQGVGWRLYRLRSDPIAVGS